mgnify:FL=1|jgi:uncharacterized membrane protein YhaH (DUF805 family)
MIYKFIDNNGSEISVNSLSSLQALVDSETVKESTKVKAGLRGKWTTASNIEELVFAKEEIEEPKETQVPQDDIKSFITKEEKTEEVPSETKSEDTSPASKPEEVSVQPWQNNKRDNKSEKIEEESNTKIQEPESNNDSSNEKSEYEIENEKIALEEEKNKIYANENLISINFVDSIKICFKKYFVVEGRASRSEYWYWFLFVFIIGLFVDYLDATIAGVPWLEYEKLYGPFGIILTAITLLPGVAVGVRRLHDVNKSGWWLLISFTVIGLIPLLIWTVSKSDSGKNQFGEYPLKFKKK